MSDESQKGDYPTEYDMADVTFIGTKMAASMVPVLGGPTTELLNAILTPSLQKRRDAWFQSLDNDFLSLRSKVSDLEGMLLTREDLVTITLQASQVALRTHQQEKLEALRNVVLNTALNLNPSEDLSLAYLGILEGLTPSHLQILKVIHEHPPRYKVHSTQTLTYDGGISVVQPQLPRHIQIGNAVLPYLEVSYPEGFFKQILADLGAEGLLDEKQTEMVVPPNGDIDNAVILSDFGNGFLAFISSSDDSA